MVREQKHVRKPHHSTAFVLLVTIFVAVFLVILTFAAIYYSGIRYLKKDFDDGSYIKFLGKVDETGTPISGTL